MRKNQCVVPVVDEGSAASGGSLTKKIPGLRSWILMDASGQEMFLKADKYAIIRRVQIHARDFRILDPVFSYPSKILCREKAIVLNLEHIKAIITAEEVLVLNPLDDKVIPVVEQLRRRLQPVNDRGKDKVDGRDAFPQHYVESEEEDENPFEFKALEVALEAICSYLCARSTELEYAVYPALDTLTSKISKRNLDILRSLKSQMTRLTARAQKVKDELHQLLTHDHDMAALYLSRKLVGRSSRVADSGAGNWSIQSFRTASKISRASRASLASVLVDENDVGRLEMLLEAYFSQIDGTLNRLATLREYIDSTEAFINIQVSISGRKFQLDIYMYFHWAAYDPKTVSLFQLLNRRNQLYQLDLGLNSGNLCLQVNSLITGIFGMNIPYTWSNDGYGYTFKWVVVFSVILTALLFIFTIAYARHKGLIGR